jgi:hypothetical protein
MLILIAGPYRSGTNDDPALMRKNLDQLESVALPLFRKGHIPLIGEWVALPLIVSPAQPNPVTPPGKKFSIPWHTDCWKDVMLCSVYKVLLEEPMKMSG